MPSIAAEQIRKIVADIDVRGFTDVTRLTLLKSWFGERPTRLPVFGLWVARHAAYRKDREHEVPKGEAKVILREARQLLGRITNRKSLFDRIDPEAADVLRLRAMSFHSDFVREGLMKKRTVNCWPVFLVEKGMGLHSGFDSRPFDGYQLAVDQTQNHNPRYGTNLNGPSRARLNDLAKFVQDVEAVEDKFLPVG